MTGYEIRVAMANHLSVVYHSHDGDLTYDDIFSISYVIQNEVGNNGERYRKIATMLTLNDKCGHSLSTVPAIKCGVENPADINDCDYVPNVKLPQNLLNIFKKQIPIRVNLSDDIVTFPRIRRLEIMLDQNSELFIQIHVGEKYEHHVIPESDIILN